MSQENNFVPEQGSYKPLTPFRLFVKSNFPFIEATYESLDNYGLYCKIVEYLNNVIENENTVEDNVTALYNSFVSLNNYVSNYFDNLDVQEEINNKLDDLVENGTLTELIGVYVDNDVLPIINNLTEQTSQLDSRIDALSTLTEGSTTGDAELVDGRTGYNGNVYSNIGNSIRGQIEWDKYTPSEIDRLFDNVKFFKLKALDAWSRYFPTGTTPFFTFKDNGGLTYHAESWSTNCSITQANIQVEATNLTLSLDITVHSIVNQDNSDGLQINVGSSMLGRIFMKNYTLGKKTRVYFDITNSDLTKNITFLFYSNGNFSIDNISLTNKLTKDYVKLYDLNYSTLQERLVDGQNVIDNMPIPINRLVNENYDVILFDKLSEWTPYFPSSSSQFVTFKGNGLEYNTTSWSQNCSIAHSISTSEPVTISFDLKVIELKEGGTYPNRFNIVKNSSVNLQGVNCSNYAVGSTTPIKIEAPSDTTTITILFIGNGHYEISNFKILTKVTEANLTGQSSIELILPKKIPCGINYETNIYYDNALYNSYIENLQCIIPSNGLGTGNSQKKRLRIYQSSSSNISETFNLRNIVNSQNLKQTSTTLVPLNSNVLSGESKKVLIIGDSLTQNGTYQSECTSMLTSAGFSVTYLGTRGTSPNFNEGRGGWSSNEYANLASYNNVTNPFYNPTSQTFDFSYYMTEQNYNSVDIVFINLGTNDMRNTNSATLTNYDKIIDSIHDYDSNIKIVIGICPPLAKKDLMSTSFGPRNKRLELTKSLLDLYDNKEANNFYICPFYLNIDAETQFNETTFSFNRYESGSTSLINDNTHPTTSGYYRMADVMFYTLCYIISLE